MMFITLQLYLLKDKEFFADTCVPLHPGTFSFNQLTTYSDLDSSLHFFFFIDPTGIMSNLPGCSIKKMVSELSTPALSCFTPPGT